MNTENSTDIRDVDSAWFVENTATPIEDRHADEPAQPVEVVVSPGGVVCIRGEATIHSAAQLYGQLTKLDLRKFEQLTLDLSGLVELDTAGAQILIAFKRAFRIASVHSCPASLRRFLELTGLTCVLIDEEH